MDPVVVSTVVGCPREEVFTYLADIANLPEFTDHFLLDWRLTREDSHGRGAGARFKVDAPVGSRFSYGELTYAELIAPTRIVAHGRYGKFCRTRTMMIFNLEPASHDNTRVVVSYETEPAILSDRLNEALFARWFWRRRLKRSLVRLRSILEDGQKRGARATIAGGPRKPASAFRY